MQKLCEMAETCKKNDDDNDGDGNDDEDDDDDERHNKIHNLQIKWDDGKIEKKQFL